MRCAFPLGLLVLLLGGACRGPAQPGDWSYGVGASALPNLGVEGTVARRLSGDERADWDLELRLVQQFLDDADFVDDGNPGAGDFTGIQVGGRLRTEPGASRHVVVRVGLQGFKARGRPNLVDLPGTYLGAYAAVGFESDLGGGWSTGPEFALLPSYGEDDFAIVPQLTWGLTFHPGRG